MASLRIEKVYPLGSGVSIFLFAAFFGLEMPVSGLNDLLSSSISIGSILAGFLATTKGILMAMPDNSFFSQFRKTGYMEDLATYLHEAIGACLAFCLINVLSFFYKSGLTVAVWAGFGCYAMLAFWRVTRIMFLVMKLSQR